MRHARHMLNHLKAMIHQKLTFGPLKACMAAIVPENLSHVSDAHCMVAKGFPLEQDTYQFMCTGARGNGKSLDTTAIQEAIDECGAKEDGGVVELAEGLTYLSGALKLPSKVTLRLRKGSVLQASTSVRPFFIQQYTTTKLNYSP